MCGCVFTNFRYASICGCVESKRYVSECHPSEIFFIHSTQFSRRMCQECREDRMISSLFMCLLISLVFIVSLAYLRFNAICCVQMLCGFVIACQCKVCECQLSRFKSLCVWKMRFARNTINPNKMSGHVI